MKIILKNIEKEGYCGDIDSYISEGGYKALKSALEMKPEEILSEILRSPD